MTPRLAVTQEQAENLFVDSPGRMLDVTLRLPERPTMPCDVCLGHGRRWRNGQPDGVQCSCHTGRIPIPEGTRVEVGYRDVVTRDDWPEYPDVRWVTVAFATLTEVHAALADGQPYRWHVTLSDIKPVEADQ